MEGRGVRILSPGKVNLHLEVGPRREDGYHEIRSLFQMIDLYDEIVIRSLKEDDICLVRGRFDCAPKDNLVHQAVRIFRRKTGIMRGVTIRVRKRIPSGAGLGGGSGNAASVLTAMNALFKAGLSRSELSRLGESLGSDVPFFFSGPAAVVTGRGEYVRLIEGRDDLWGVVVRPDASVSTPEAYGWFDEDGGKMELSDRTDEDIIRMYGAEKPSRWNYTNSFYSPVCRRKPVVAEAVLRIQELGAEFSQMSGSGSACFGIFTENSKAEHVRKLLLNWYSKVWVVQLLARSPSATIL